MLASDRYRKPMSVLDGVGPVLGAANYAIRLTFPAPERGQGPVPGVVPISRDPKADIGAALHHAGQSSTASWVGQLGPPKT